MMRFLLNLLMISAGLILSLQAFAQKVVEQEADANKMAVIMRSDGKIYVVVAVLVTVLLGLFLYLISLDKKISKLEKEHA